MTVCRVSIMLLGCFLCSSAIAQDGPEFRRGDCDGNGFVEPLLDSYFLISSAFSSGPAPPCMEATDADNNGVAFWIIDSLYLMNWAFAGGPELDAPGPFECGIDPEGGDLGCDSEPSCAGGATRTFSEDLDYTLSVEDVTGLAGSTVTVAVLLEVADRADEVVGVTWSVCHEPGVTVETEGLSIGSAIDETSDQFSGVLAGVSGWSGAILMNLITGATLGSGVDQELATAEYSLLETGVTVLEICTLGSTEDGEFPVRPAVIHSGFASRPALLDGSITIEDPVFKRGDVDGNGQVFSILDGLYLLEWGFTLGPPPFCFDAADADDNGEVFPILDAITIFNWGFTGGPAPPDPGAFECGVDPTEDDLPCEAISGCE